MADKKITAAAIVQKWDGGERRVAIELARKAGSDETKKAQVDRPELARYMAPDFAG
jgi:hypothetical protein